eukprot:scaffold20036_cov73-Cylindrotheca_fusiformis.AAC.1
MKHFDTPDLDFTDTVNCWAAAQFSFVCGCGVRPYVGATTKGQQAILVWTLRMAGLDTVE